MSAITANITKYRTRSGARYRVRITNRRLLREAAAYNRAGFQTRREAEAYARSVREKVARLEQGQVEFGRTFGELADRYEQDVACKSDKKARRVCKAHLSYWRGVLGEETPLVDISPRRVTEGLHLLATKPVESAPRGKCQASAPNAPPISAGTINRYRSTLSATFTFAMKDLWWIDRNPVRDTRTAKEPSGRVRWLEPDELQRLGRIIDGQTGHLPLMFWLALSTGARLGEILAATWHRVRFAEDGSATLTLEKTKNGESRVLPIVLPKAVHLLKTQKIRHGAESDLVIPPERPGAAHCRWRGRWKEALNEAGIVDFRFHDLRHCFASYLAMEGHDIIQIADLTGHKTVAMVRRYSHLNPRSRMRNAASAIAAMGLIDT